MMSLSSATNMFPGWKTAEDVVMGFMTNIRSQRLHAERIDVLKDRLKLTAEIMFQVLPKPHLQHIRPQDVALYVPEVRELVELAGVEFPAQQLQDVLRPFFLVVLRLGCRKCETTSRSSFGNKETSIPPLIPSRSQWASGLSAEGVDRRLCFHR